MSTTIKQVIVLRTRFPDGRGGFFKPRMGKLVAQGAHASMKVFFDRGEVDCTLNFKQTSSPYDLVVPLTEDMKCWVTGIFTKIVVGVESEEELLALEAQAKSSDLPHALIRDVGLTEFHGVPTVTALAIGPAEASLIDAITGHLKLL